MSSYLTTASASSTYQTQSGMSSYQTTAGMSSYLTTTSASSTYLTQTNASSTYQTVTGMSNYANISNLNKLTGSYASTGGSVALNFGDSQYLILEGSPIVTNIALPSPTTTSNIGAVFSIVNRVGNVASRNVSAPSGQFIWDFNTNTNLSNFSMNGVGVCEFVCVGLSSTSTTTWAVLNRDDTVLKSGNQTIGGTKTFSTAPVMSGASISAGTIPLTALSGQTSIMSFPVGTSFSQRPNTTITTGVIWDFLNSSGTRRGWINGSSATAVAYTTSSDRRLKKDIEILPSQIDNIKKLNACKYKWIESNEDDIGFIYQEVKEILPLFDDKQDDSNYHGLDYGKFTPYLWSGVSELINRVEALETTTSIEPNPNIYLLKDAMQKINTLEATISNLQKQLNAINNILISKNML